MRAISSHNPRRSPPAACARVPSHWANGLIAALFVAAPSFAQQPLGCLIEAERITDIGSPVVGVVERVDVERGDRVSKGQILVVLRASVEQATLTVATSRADSSAELQAAEANASFNRERLVRAEDLFRQQFISQQALDQARTEADLADHKLAQAKEQRTTSRQERDVAAAQLLQRVIRSPIDGVVAERFVSAGERVDDKPLLRVAKVDPLRVQLVMPVSMYSQVQNGGSAKVVPELKGAVAVTARVSMIDKVVDAASNTFRVHLSLPNPKGALPAGLRCKAEFANQAVAAPAPPTAATALPTAAAPTSPAAAKTQPAIAPAPAPATAVSQLKLHGN